jgi:hypothetical protein
MPFSALFGASANLPPHYKIAPRMLIRVVPDREQDISGQFAKALCASSSMVS